MAKTQSQQSQHRDAQAQGNGLGDLAVVDTLACEETRSNQTDGIDGKE